MKDCYLVLENGAVYSGNKFGNTKETYGELVFTTAMTGYQESITDPSYCGQLLTFTYPLIGNYGINRDDFESLNTTCEAIIIKDLARRPSHFKSRMTLDEFCKLKGIPGISGIDTRSITRILRDSGVMRSAIIYDKTKIDATLQALQEFVLNIKVASVSTKSCYVCPGTGYSIVVVDFGLKENLLRELSKRNCQITVLPYNSTAQDVLKYAPDGILLSNGPGNPEDMVEAIELVKNLQGKIPIFGVCLGHQILGLANGAKTYKMKFGHRGYNHPVKEIATGYTYFTSQNHGYAIEANSVPKELIVTHLEINDNTVEGIKHRTQPAFSVQFHPEGAPGPFDARHIFDEFMEMIYVFQGR